MESFKYTLDHIGKKDLVFLLRNNKSLICPFAVLGNDETECGSWCPHFDIKPHVGQVYLTCSGNKVVYLLEEE